MTTEKDIVKRDIEIRRCKTSALNALTEYIQHGGNIETIIELATADPEWYADLIARLSPSGKLPIIARRLRSAGINKVEFADRVNLILNRAHDKMIQPEDRRVIITNLSIALSEARKTAPKIRRK